MGMKVLDSKETPGLGDKIVKDTAFIDGFQDVGTPLVGVKKGQGNGGHDEVVMITGATISSRAVIKIINDRLEALKGPVDKYWSTTLTAGTVSSRVGAAGIRDGGRWVVRQTTQQEDLIRGIWKENPVLVQLLGLCPTLAVTNTVANSIAMGLATFFVLLGSSILVATLKRWIPKEVRISAYILIIATFVTIADLVLNAVVPVIHKELGAFIALIVVNCMILGRQEAFASKNTVWRSMLDAVGIGHRLHRRPAHDGLRSRDPRQRDVPGPRRPRPPLRAVGDHDPAARRLLHAGRHPAGPGVVEGASPRAGAAAPVAPRRDDRGGGRAGGRWRERGRRMMGELFWILISAMLVNNFTLVLFLGLCPFLGVSARVSTALRMGMANIFVLVITSMVASLLNAYVLPYAPYLRLISFIVVIASLVQIVEMAIKKLSPTLFRELGIFLPLITTNCAILGLAIFQTNRGYGFVEGLFFAVGGGLGLTLALVLMASIRETVEIADVPAMARNMGLVLILAGSLSLAFMGFAGLFSS